MRIAYILGVFPAMSETFIGEEIRALEAMGHDVFPIALHKPQTDFQPEDVALSERTLYFSPLSRDEALKEMRRFGWKLWRILPFMRLQTTEPYFPFLAHISHIAAHIHAHRCTHIHAHFAWGATTYAIGVAKLLKLPVTFTCHGSDAYARPVDLALKCRTANAVFGVAPTITTDLQKLAPRTPCDTVFCGVDTKRFLPVSDETQKNNRWLFVGRLMECKGIGDILAAWAQIPSETRLPLDIVGDGPLKNELLSLVSQHNLEQHVVFLGVRDAAWIRKNGPRYRAFISAFKHGADGSQDTAPMVLKEAMAMALPIVTTDFIDIPLIVGTECAVLCPTASPTALATAIMTVQELSPDALQTMGSAGRARVEQLYSLTQQAQHMTRLFAS